MLNTFEQVTIYLSIILSIFSLIFIILSMRLSSIAMKRGLLGSILNLKYKQLSKLWNWVSIIPFVIIVARVTELIKNFYALEAINGYYRIFDFLISLTVFVLSFSYYFLLKAYMKKR